MQRVGPSRREPEPAETDTTGVSSSPGDSLHVNAVRLKGAVPTGPFSSRWPNVPAGATLCRTTKGGL
jgi:hypothetical protein